MKYIFEDARGAFDLVQYERYLDAQRNNLRARVHGAELLTIDRFVPTGPRCFHDARLLSLSVATETSVHAEGEAQSLQVQLRLKGPYFDRTFELTYEGVESCRFDAPAPNDDLLMHELRGEDGLLIHEVQFDNGKLIVVACRTLWFLEALHHEAGAR